MTSPGLPDELLDREPPPGVRFIRAWLAALPGDSGAERKPRDPLPFTILERYDGWEDSVTDYGFYQLDHLAQAVEGKTAYTVCEDYSRLVKRRMLYLRDHPWTEVLVPEWGLATADRVHCVLSPKNVAFEDPKIERMTSRYEIHLRLVAPPS